MVKMGRFVVDTHVHAQRTVAGPALRKKAEQAGESPKKKLSYRALAETLREVTAYDNSERLLFDMDTYGVDMCIIRPTMTLGMTNELNLAIVDKNPGKFAALCTPRNTFERALRGEIKWSIDEACSELDKLLSTGKYVGIGEGMPIDPMVLTGKKREPSRQERIGDMLQAMEVARKHKVPIYYHTGHTMGYVLRMPETLQPLWAHELAAAFPDVSLIFDHGGIQGWWWEHFTDQCLHVAAAHDNVYLECGYWWTDLYYKALNDPNVGAEKLLFGTDWGASIPIYSQPNRYPPSYPVQLRKEGIVTYQVDCWGWAFKQMLRLDISQDDLNLILGGNAIRLFKLKFPLTRMFKPVEIPGE
jgi:predicted TIM-barrel fold metal-dependent hydrolase